MNKQKTQKLIEAVYLYSQGIDNTRTMDWLTVECTDQEWKFCCQMLDFVDELEVDNGKGTVQQTETVLAKRENRPDRNASVFDDKHKRMEVAYQLSDEFTKKKIPFQS